MCACATTMPRECTAMLLASVVSELETLYLRQTLTGEETGRK